MKIRHDVQNSFHTKTWNCLQSDLAETCVCVKCIPFQEYGIIYYRLFITFIVTYSKSVWSCNFSFSMENNRDLVVDTACYCLWFKHSQSRVATTFFKKVSVSLHIKHRIWKIELCFGCEKPRKSAVKWSIGYFIIKHLENVRVYYIRASVYILR